MSASTVLSPNKTGQHLLPARLFPADEAALTGWLHRSLSHQYDAVLAEDLPPAMLALAEIATSGH